MQSTSDLSNISTGEHCLTFVFFPDSCLPTGEVWSPQFPSVLTEAESDRHEFVGCSLLFIVDQQRATVRLIDFAKTKRLPDGIVIDHESLWEPGSFGFSYRFTRGAGLDVASGNW